MTCSSRASEGVFGQTDKILHTPAQSTQKTYHLPHLRQAANASTGSFDKDPLSLSSLTSGYCLPSHLIGSNPRIDDINPHWSHPELQLPPIISNHRSSSSQEVHLPRLEELGVNERAQVPLISDPPARLTHIEEWILDTRLAAQEFENEESQDCGSISSSDFWSQSAPLSASGSQDQPIWISSSDSDSPALRPSACCSVADDSSDSDCGPQPSPFASDRLFPTPDSPLRSHLRFDSSAASGRESVHQKKTSRSQEPSQGRSDVKRARYGDLC